MAAVSLVLCLATMGLRVRSFRNADRLIYGSGTQADFGETGHMLLSCQGIFSYTFGYRRNWNKPQPLTWGTGLQFKSEPALYGDIATNTVGMGRQWLGFGYYHRDTRSRSSTGRQWSFGDFGLFAPHWSIALALAAFPAIRATSIFRRRRRRGRNVCEKCGYDLRASPERCPECSEVRPTR
jgi:hypothetical protein